MAWNQHGVPVRGSEALERFREEADQTAREHQRAERQRRAEARSREVSALRAEVEQLQVEVASLRADLNVLGPAIESIGEALDKVADRSEQMIRSVEDRICERLSFVAVTVDKAEQATIREAEQLKKSLRRSGRALPEVDDSSARRNGAH